MHRRSAADQGVGLAPLTTPNEGAAQRSDAPRRTRGLERGRVGEDLLERWFVMPPCFKYWTIGALFSVEAPATSMNRPEPLDVPFLRDGTDEGHGSA